MFRIDESRLVLQDRWTKQTTYAFFYFCLFYILEWPGPNKIWMGAEMWALPSNGCPLASSAPGASLGIARVRIATGDHLVLFVCVTRGMCAMLLLNNNNTWRKGVVWELRCIVNHAVVGNAVGVVSPVWYRGDLREMGWYLADVMVKFCFVFCRFAGGLARRRESTALHLCVWNSYCCCAGRRPLEFRIRKSFLFSL